MVYTRGMNKILDLARTHVRAVMRRIARGLNALSGGKLSPNAVTIVGLLAHLPIAYLIADGTYGWAAGLLVVFGLFDTLDGELARLQKKASNAGMVLDATTDRMKEVILYAGVAVALVDSLPASQLPLAAAVVVAACGGSLLVSYVKAKGETAVKDSQLTPNEINRLFQDGFLRFEVRMFVLVVGLLSGELLIAVSVIAALAWLTAFDRLIRITQKV